MYPRVAAVLHDVVVEGRDREGPTALKAPVVRANAALWPLILHRRLDVSALVLEEPDLALVRDSTGTWNWQRMLERKASGANGTPGGKSSFTLRDLRISKATVRVIDDVAEPGRSVSYRLDPIDVDLRGYQTGRRFNLDIDGMMVTQEARGGLRFGGSVGPLPVPFQASQVPIQGTLAASGFPLRTILPYVRSESGIRSLDGTATSDLAINVSPGGPLQAKGRLEFDQLLLALGGPNARSATLDLEAALDITSTEGGKNLEVRKMDLQLAGGRLSVTGESRTVGQQSTHTFQLDGAGVRTGDVAPLASLLGIRLPLDLLGGEPFDVKGTVQAKTPVNGGTQVVLQNLALGGVHAFMYRNPDGSWSAGRTASPRQGGAGSRVEVANLSVKNGDLTLQDAVAGHGKPVALHLENVDLQVDHYGGNDASRGSLAANFAEHGGHVEFRGTLGPARDGRTGIDGTLLLENARMAAIRQYFPGGAGLSSGDGAVDVNASIQGRLPADLAVRGTLGLRDVAIDFRKPDGGATRRVLKGDVVFDLLRTNGGARTAFRSVKVTLPSGAFTFSGSIEHAGSRTPADLTLAPARIRMEELQAIASLVGFTIPGTIASPEPVAISLHVGGDLANRRDLRLNGSIGLSGARWSTSFLKKPIDDLQADLRFIGDGVEAKDISARLGETPLRGNLTVRNFAAPQVTFTLQSDSTNLTELLAMMSGGGSPQGGARAPAGNSAMSKLSGRGSILISRGVFNTFAFSNLRADAALSDRVLTLKPLGFAIAGGTYQGGIQVDLRGAEPAFSFDGTLSGVDANTLLASNTRYKDFLLGTLSGKIDMSARGKTMDAVIPSLHGTGEMEVQNGKVAKLSILEGLANVAGLFGSNTLAQVSHRVSSQETPFQVLKTAFAVNGGRVTTQNFGLQSIDFLLRASGGFAFSGGLGLDGHLIFSDALSQSLRAERSPAIYLGEEAGRVAIPLKLAGTISKPSFNVDLARAGEYAVTKTLTEKITDVLFGGKKKSADTSAASVPPAAGPIVTAPQASAPTPAPAAPDSTAPMIRVDTHRFLRNLPQPDLLATGAVSGSGLMHVTVVAVDEQGKELYRQKVLADEIAAAYGGTDRHRPVTLPFRLRIPGASIPPNTRIVRVSLTANTETGPAAAADFSQEKALPGLQ